MQLEGDVLIKYMCKYGCALVVKQMEIETGYRDENEDVGTCKC